MKQGRMKGQAFVGLPSELAAQRALRDTNGLLVHDKPIVVVSFSIQSHSDFHVMLMSFISSFIEMKNMSNHFPIFPPFTSFVQSHPFLWYKQLLSVDITSLYQVLLYIIDDKFRPSFLFPSISLFFSISLLYSCPLSFFLFIPY